MGQLSFADDGDLGAGVGDHLALAAVPHHRDLRAIVHRLRVFAELHHGESVAIGNCAADWADVSALYFFHDYGSENDRAFEEVAMHRGVSGGVRGISAAPTPGGLRAVLRA